MADPATATAGIVLLLMMMAGGGKKRRGKGKRCAPFEYNASQVELSITSAITSGMRGRQTIAIVVATAIWPRHPKTNAKITWPPSPNASTDVKCLWKLLLAQIDKHLKDRDIPPWPDCPPDLPHLNLAAQRCETPPVPPPPPPPDDDDDGDIGDIAPPPPPPPFNPEDWETPVDADYPTPGTLLQVRYGDRLLGKWSAENTGSDPGGQALRSIAYTTLLTAGYMAAKEIGGLSDDEAAAFARKVAYDGNNRMEYVQLIQCSPWNDALYTTYGFGTTALQSPAGRALRFYPNHYDNRTRLIQGLAPKRNITMGTIADKKSGNATGQDPSERNFSYIWLPKINLQMLWDSDGRDVTTEGIQWEDGSNGIMPPPQVMDFDVENVPQAVSWGCLGYEATSFA